MNFFRSLSRPTNIIKYLGNITSGNIKTLLPDFDYTHLTTNNFIVEPAKNIPNSEWSTGIDWEHHGGSDFTVYVSATATYNVSKSYNAATGDFSCSISAAGSNPGVKVYCYDENKIFIPQDLEDTMVYKLGTGTSFDIRAMIPTIDYTKLTVHDFIVECKTVKGGASAGRYDQTGSGSGSVNIGKSYNSSNGIFNISGTRVDYDCPVHGGYWDGQSAGSGWSSVDIVSYVVKGTIIN